MNKENYLIHSLKSNAIFKIFIFVSWWVFSDVYDTNTAKKHVDREWKKNLMMTGRREILGKEINFAGTATHSHGIK